MVKLLSKSAIGTAIFISVLAQAGLAQNSTPPAEAAAATPGFIPGHVSTSTASTTLNSGVDDHTKSHAGYAKQAQGFLSTTTSSLEGYTIKEYKGLVEGAAVRVPTWNEDASAGVQERQGGKIDSYTHLCEEARVEAFSTMVQRAKDLGANGVIGIHFDSQVMPLDQGRFASGVVCVGTAVNVSRK